jgi:4-amino-4-deoxy-L-arabinose transferase-like glycosyltransferase
MSSLLRRVLIGVRRYPVCASVLVALAVALPGLGQGEFSVDTGWYGAIALQSWRAALAGDPGALWSLWGQGGDPGAGGLSYFNKPPLGFWLNGAPLAALGPGLIAARLGSLAAAALCVGIVAHLGRAVAGRGAGLACGLVLALTYEFVRHAHAFSLDLWLAACVTGFLAVVLPGTLGSKPSGRGWSRWVVGGVLLGLGLMTKPLVALAAPLILALGLLGARRRVPVGKLAASVAAALAVALPWHLSMVQIHGRSFSDQYLGREVLERAAGSKAADTPPAWFYLAHLAQAYWPWLIVLVLAGVAAVRGWAPAALRRVSGQGSGAAPARGSPGAPERTRAWSAAVVALVWTALWLAVLSVFPDRRPRYALVIYPPAALACGLFLVCGAGARVRRLTGRVAPAACVAAIAAGCVLGVVPVRVHRGEPEQWAKFFEWFEKNGRPVLYDGGMEGSRGARLYLREGVWPRPMLDQAGRPIAGAEPGPGSLVMYHRRDLMGPGPGEKVEFSEGDLVVTRR